MKWLVMDEAYENRSIEIHRNTSRFVHLISLTSLSEFPFICLNPNSVSVQLIVNLCNLKLQTVSFKNLVFSYQI